MIIKAHAYPRAGLVGNPSDGYFGKTISFTFSNFRAEVELYESPDLEILPNTRDHSRFASIRHLASDVQQFGYYGGIRLLKATVKRFHDYCLEQGIELEDKNFTLRYHTDIPSQVGLAGSSAIITACLRALMAFYGVTIPKPIQANLILSVEKKELNIAAGLQDRVIQTYEGVVYMNFAREIMARQGYGEYVELDPKLLPPLYIAYRTDLAESSEMVHNDIRSRFERGEKKVVDAMKFWANLTDKVRDCLLKRDNVRLPALLNSNFDMRRKVYEISKGNIMMVDTARSVGASSKFTGSGGAILGTYSGEAMYRRLVKAFAAVDVEVFKPVIKVSDPA